MKKDSLAVALVFAAMIAARLPAQEATSQPATSAATIDATDTAKLKEMAGKSATVRGEISGSYAAKTVLLLNFKDTNRGFTVAIRKVDQDALNNSFGGDVAGNLKGKTVLVTGEIKLYKEKPEIEVTKPEQIQLESK